MKRKTDTILLVGGSEIYKYTIAGLLWRIISKVLKVNFNHRIVEVDSVSELEDLIEEVKYNPYYRGFNIACPWKSCVMNYVDTPDDFTKDTSICNTIINRSGTFFSYNTDVYGITEAFCQHIGKNIIGEDVLILGAGGAGQSLSHFLIKNNFCRVHVYDIDTIKLEKLRKTLASKKLHIIRQYSEIANIIRDVDLLVNATPVGKMNLDGSYTNGLLPLRKEEIMMLKKSAVVQEMNYFPVYSKLLITAHKNGNLVVPGTNMLAFQAIKTFEHIYQRQVSIDLSFKIIKKLEKEIDIRFRSNESVRYKYL